MGTHLYEDRGVAIRELYQNALDALRYRAARYEYLGYRTGASVPWQGSIEFVQGVDDHGRAFLDCVDNGIGMGEEELRTCFSRVGVRFASQPEFVREKSEWERCNPPVRMYPNSRFGIGVMSYFMLANEIEVTTCRMDQRGAAGPGDEDDGSRFRADRADQSGTSP
ncbi:Chaperone protein HtpG [Streptomyces alboniger]